MPRTRRRSAWRPATRSGATCFLAGLPASAPGSLCRLELMLQSSTPTASSQSLKRAVLDGGFTLISRLAVEAEVQAETLCALRVTGAQLKRPLRAVRRRRAAVRGAARLFWRFLEGLQING